MVDQDFPHQSFNLIGLLVSFLAFIWGWNAFQRFFSVLNYRYAVLTENTVMLRGLGGHLSQFAGTMPSHTRSILHTRNATAAKDVKFMYVPFHVVHSMEPPKEDTSVRARNNVAGFKIGSSDRLSIPVIGTAKDNEHNNKKVSFSVDNAGPYSYGFLNQTFSPHPVNAHEIIPKAQTKLCGYVPVWCATNCTILVLYGLNMANVKRFFRYSIKANKLFMKGSKYRDRSALGSVSDTKKTKGKKYDKLDRGSSDRHIYAERLVSLFTKKDLCTAFTSMESNTTKDSGSSERVYRVPIYDTSVSSQSLKRDHHLLDHNEVSLNTYKSHEEEVDLSTGERGKVSSSSTIRYGGNRSGSAGGGDKTKRGENNSIPHSITRQSIGILIIPRDLPYTGTPELVSSNSHSSESTCSSNGGYVDGSSKPQTSNLEGDVELGVGGGVGAFFNSKPIGRVTANGDSRASVDRNKYISLDFGLQVLHPSVSEAAGTSVYDMDELYVHAAGSMFTANDIYGLANGDNGVPEGSGESLAVEEGSNECVICLTESQDIFLLPCRHLCVCKECFPHIDKCPVCRSAFDDYVTVRHDRLISVKTPKCVHRPTNREEDKGSVSGRDNLERDTEKEGAKDGKYKSF